ncbi:hypothetical protein GCM10017620_14040 [Brevundimonas intermedia]|uniref:Uncharacterized protein n=1 Tax=Brevundimonas intermedia TaxID=74315 RepID=A0ABQ5T9E0_9CAUL|nr:hypothetical protein [Brevundimonas intermedia]GLK48431.1 hypothetical protein GCM10017620_14040 [Brevundimonas intermedia]
MRLISRHFDVFADYFQFYVCDAAFQTDPGLLWDEAATARMLAIGPDLIAVGTARNMTVPVEIEVLNAAPAPDLDDWDQIVDCGVSLPSGKLIVFGCTENSDDADRIGIEPGDYAARISYANLGDLSDDGLEGDDRYRVQLWRAAIPPITVLKASPK